MEICCVVLIFCFEHTIVASVNVVCPLGKSDHILCHN